MNDQPQAGSNVLPFIAPVKGTFRRQLAAALKRQDRSQAFKELLAGEVESRERARHARALQTLIRPLA